MLLRYEELVENPAWLRTWTGVDREEIEQLLPSFARAWEAHRIAGHIIAYRKAVHALWEWGVAGGCVAWKPNCSSFWSTLRPIHSKRCKARCLA